MRITRIEKDHQFVALLALQRQGRLPKECIEYAVKEFLLCDPQLVLSAEDAPSARTRHALTMSDALNLVVDQFVKQPDLLVVHKPTDTKFEPFSWLKMENTDGEARTLFDSRRGEQFTVQGQWTSVIPWQGFVGAEIPEWYEEAVGYLRGLDEEAQATMLAAVRSPDEVLVCTEADADDYVYMPQFPPEFVWNDPWGLHDRNLRPICDAVDNFVDDLMTVDDLTAPDLLHQIYVWSRVRFCLSKKKKTVLRNVECRPNTDSRGSFLFANVGEEVWLGDDPRDREEGLILLRSAGSDGPPRPLEVVLAKKGDFSVVDLIRAVLKVKSHKAENWYERVDNIKIVESEDTVFLDVDFDYGS